MSPGGGFLFLLAVAIMAGLSMPKTAQARGIRNNNPGNIRKGNDRWQGLAPDAEQTDPSFWVFVSPVYGIRAMAKTLRTYYEKHGIATIRGMVTRYAPPSENKTGSYVSAVAGALGVDADKALSLEEFRGILPRLVAAMIHHENGSQPYDVAEIQEGVNKAWA